MSIKNKLFKALNSIVKSEDDFKELKSHLNNINKSFFGNELKPSKNDVYTAKLFGAKNSNVLPTIVSEKIDNHEDFSKFIDENMENLFSDYATMFYADEINENPMFHVPILKFQIKNMDTSVKHTYYAMLELTLNNFDKENQTLITHTLYLYDSDEEDFIEIPDNWDLETDDLDYIIENYLEIGVVQSKKLTEEAVNLLGFIDDRKFEDYILINDISTVLAKEFCSISKSVTGITPVMDYEKIENISEGKTFHIYNINY